MTPAGALSDADWALYESRATAACDAKDGVVDGIIANPLACKFHTATLLCKPGKTEGCLTAPKLDLIRAMWPTGSMTTPTGTRTASSAAASSYRCAVDPALVRYMSRPSLVGS